MTKEEIIFKLLEVETIKSFEIVKEKDEGSYVAINGRKYYVYSSDWATEALTAFAFLAGKKD